MRPPFSLLLLLLLLYAAVTATTTSGSSPTGVGARKPVPEGWNGLPPPGANDAFDPKELLDPLLELGTDVHDAELDASLVPLAKNKRIPLSLLIQLRDIADVDDLFDRVIEPTQRYKRRGLKSATEITKRGRGGGGRKNRKSLKTNLKDSLTTNEDNDGEGDMESRPSEFGPIFDKRAFCHPRRQPTNIPQPDDPTLIYQPMCIQVERCGGCCAHELFECVASVTRNATRKVVALRYPHSGAEFFVIENVTKVRVERHTKCKCQCKIQPEDCGPRHIYDRQNCRCVCASDDGHLKCKDNQVWIANECRCRCPDYGECSTGTYFDTRMCRCRAPGEILTQNKIVKNQLTKSFH